MDNYIALENKYIGLVNRVLTFIRPKFDKINIIVAGPDLERTDDHNYTSEISISFYRNKNLLDILEFFVIRNGDEDSSLEEIHDWLLENLETIYQEKLV